MAISDPVQTLTAAFSFGILLETASGGIFIYSKGHGSTILHDGPRLALVLFLLFAALWGQVDFVNLMLPKTSTSACQGTLIISTIFDQLARVAIEQFLLWSIGRGTKLSAERIIMQGTLVARLIAGGVFVGFSRPDFSPTCIPRSDLLPTAIIVLALDVIIIFVLIIRALSFGMFGDLRKERSSARQGQSKALILVVAGFTVWTGTSVARILGLPGVILVLRTTLPANGLLILVGLVILFSEALLSPKEGEMTTPEAQSPFVASAILSRDILRDNHGNGSPKSGNIYAKSGKLFVVNQTPHESPTYFQTRHESDTRGFRKFEEETTRQNFGLEQGQTSSKHGPGYRGSSGVFGSMVAAPMIGDNQGPLARQIRPPPAKTTREVVPGLPTPNAQQKKPSFWSKPPAKTPIRHLGISEPIRGETDGSDERPFARIPTVDLATAAINERERREAAVSKARLLTNKPMPPPPSFSPREGLRKSISTTRKEMPVLSRGALPTVPGSAASSLLATDTIASSSSASLSPGREEVRRRSPRNMNEFDLGFDENFAFQPGLQRKPTIGLPSNPRSQRAAMTRGQDMPKEQNVMYMSNTIYESPGMVKTIIRDAAEPYEAAQRTKTADQSSIASYTTTLKPSNSMIHRPRPYRKDSEKERALFPAEPSPHHKRSKSGSRALDPTEEPLIHKRSKSSSAISSRRSLFGSPLGSPTQLPPLPPMPKSASELRRLLPNNTKSMTFDEKIQLLFPAPPRSTLIQKRRSSVPSLPRVPSVFMSESLPTRSPTEEEAHSRRASKRTTIASFAMVADPSFQIISPRLEANEGEAHHILRFSPNIYQTNISDGTWIPNASTNENKSQNELQESQKRQSLKGTRKSTLTEVSSTNGSYQDDSTTYWGSVHSNIPHVDMKKARRNARTTFIPRGLWNRQVDASTNQPPPRIEITNDKDFIPMILDTEESNFSASSVSDTHRLSFLLDVDEELPGDRTPSATTTAAWHHRIGDQLPTFSERDSKVRSRKMPPPTPLLLNKMGRHATIVIHAAEPSPVESPEKAIEEIKAQLKRLEEPNRDSFGSILRHVDNTQIQIEDRLRLLESLEKEMGQQEDQWQQMQTNLGRSSTSTVSTLWSPPLPPPKDKEFSRRPSQRDSRRLSRVTSRHARVRSSITQIPKGEDSTCTTSTQSSDNSRASIWQQRLAEAQLEYMENAPTLLRKSLNFLSISNVQLGSPTPPDSLDSGTDNETELESGSENERTDTSTVSQKQTAALWQLTVPSPRAPSGRLWNRPFEIRRTRISPSEPAARKIRPSQRLDLQPLQISSSSLWSKPTSPDSRGSAFGLWRSKTARPPSITLKRASQRPKRKVRRLTYLPDIIESPLPLPHKRETLGIFQFPWGEPSDQPVYQPTFIPNFLPSSSSTTNSKFAVRSHQAEPESSEYTPSFFDDYDDEEDGDDEANYEDSDDEFDETTLSDIADLLKSTEVPSRHSLMFSPRQIIEDYDDDTDFESDSEVDEIVGVAALAPIRLPIPPLAMNPKRQPRLENDDFGLQGVRVTESLSPLESDIPFDLAFSTFSSFSSVEKASMWTQKSVTTDNRKSSLFSVHDEQQIIRGTESPPAAMQLLKAPRKLTPTLPLLASQNLWSGRKNTAEETKWLSTSPGEYSMSTIIPLQLLWKPAPRQTMEPVMGLFDVSAPKLGNRATNSEPAALKVSRKASVIQASTGTLGSNKLWNRPKDQPLEHDWISESSVRPASPSICSSNTSSGRTSPSFDISSEDASDAASIQTVNTQASSLCGSHSSTAHAAMPAWWDIRSKKTLSPPPVKDNKQTNRSPASSTGAEEARLNPKIPMLHHQKSREVLATVRESRVLATRNLWEAKALGDNALVKAVKTEVPEVPETPVIPTQETLRRHRRSIATKADWDAALSEVTEASAAQRKCFHPTVTKVEWVAALIQAVKESKSKMQRIQATPEMWEAAVAEATAMGQTSITVQVPPAVQLWSSSTDMVPSSQGLLWSKNSIPNRAIVLEALPLCDLTARKPLPAENIEFGTLESTELWQPTQAFILEWDWLSQKPVCTRAWAPRTISNGTRANDHPTIWSALLETTSQDPDLFAHIPGDVIKKSKPSRPTTLQRLNSSRLFTATSDNDQAINWLHSTSFYLISLPVQQSMPKLIRSLTWTAPSFSPITNSKTIGLWHTPSEPLNKHSIISLNLETEIWSRKKRSLVGADIERTIIQASSLWRPFSGIPESPKNWLLKARVSKVQFRY